MTQAAAGQGQPDGEEGAGDGGAGDGDPAPMAVCDALGDGQPQTVAPLAPGPVAVSAVEALEQAGQMLRRDGLAGVVDGEDCLVSLGAEDQ